MHRRYTNAEIVASRPAVQRPGLSDEPLDCWRELEVASKAGQLADAWTVLLRGSECQFRCLMCDLWQGTHVAATPQGTLPRQLSTALSRLHDVSASKGWLANESPAGLEDSPELARTAIASERWVKLYNASNFFADLNVPKADHAAIASQLDGFERVVVENHPRLISDDIDRFRRSIAGKLEVALGLETVHAETLEFLNKRMDADDFRNSCEWLQDHDVDVRTFVLLGLPFHSDESALDWCLQSVAFAEDCGVRHVSIIPTRSSQGLLKSLADSGEFRKPSCALFEEALFRALDHNGCVVTGDLWDWAQLDGSCHACVDSRRNRILKLNLTQRQPEAVCECPYGCKVYNRVG